MTVAETIERAVDFLFANRERIQDEGLRTCDRDTAGLALTFHAVHNQLRLEWHAGAVVGLGIAWRDDAERLRAATAKGEEMFQWEPGNPHGDCIYLGLFVSTERGVAARLARYFRAKFPRLPELAHRRGRLISRPWLATYCQHP
jgi:hypothetical protein